MAVRFQGLLCFTLLLAKVASATQCADIEADSGNGTGPAEVLVLLQTVQSEMLGPTALPKSQWSSFGTWGAFFGLEGLAVGVVLDGASSLVGRKDKARTLEGVRSASGIFDFEAAILDGINDLDLCANWQLLGVQQGNYVDKSAGRATRLFRDTSVEYVMYIRPYYFVSPGLNQIRVFVGLVVYSRPLGKSRLKAMYRRTFEYLSPSRGDLFRPFREGEKEALIQEIENNFKELVEKYPANRSAYRKYRRDALDALNSSDVILPIMAVNEGWPGTSFDDELTRATRHIFYMLEEELRDVNPGKSIDGHPVNFDALDSSGKPNQFKGHVSGHLDSNTIYRDEDGNYYSVP